MAFLKVGRKIKRAGKVAVQFRFTATFEYIDLECCSSWRPEDVRVIWQRSHRKIESNLVKWRPVADRGPDGATGRALFDPPIAVALIVTLYQAPRSTEYEEKDYKFYIENDGGAGRKILASFHCDLASYAGMPNSKSSLELSCKPVSKKIRKAQLGVTLESEYIKEGIANDDDMQSTYSHVTAMGDEHANDGEDFSDGEEDDEEEGKGQSPTILVNGGVKEKEEQTRAEESATTTGASPAGSLGQEAGNTTPHATHGAHSEAEKGKTPSLTNGVVSGSGSESYGQAQVCEQHQEGVIEHDHHNGAVQSENNSIGATGSENGQPLKTDEKVEVGGSGENKGNSLPPQTSVEAGNGSSDLERNTHPHTEPADQSMVIISSTDVRQLPVEDTTVVASGGQVDANTGTSTNASTEATVLEPKPASTPPAVNTACETAAREAEIPMATGSAEGKSRLQTQDKGSLVIVSHSSDPPANSLHQQKVVESGSTEQAPKKEPQISHKTGNEVDSSVANDQNQSVGHEIPAPAAGETRHPHTGRQEPSCGGPLPRHASSEGQASSVNGDGRTDPILNEHQQQHQQQHTHGSELIQVDKSGDDFTAKEIETESQMPEHSSSPSRAVHLSTADPVANGLHTGSLQSTSQQVQQTRAGQQSNGSRTSPCATLQHEVTSDRHIRTTESSAATATLVQESPKLLPKSDKNNTLCQLQGASTVLAANLGRYEDDDPGHQILDVPPKKPPRSPWASLKRNAVLQVPSEETKPTKGQERKTSTKETPTPALLEMSDSSNPEELARWLPPTTQLVTPKNKSLPLSTLYRSKVFGLYFTALWCPPCRKFMPKLVKFNEVLKENNARFSFIYISSDHTEDDMLEHLQTNSVTFPAIKYGDPAGDKLREKFGIRQVPHLVIIDSSGRVIDDHARKVVEMATSGSSAINVYGKWLEGQAVPREKKGVLVSLFSKGGEKKKANYASEPLEDKAKVEDQLPSVPTSPVGSLSSARLTNNDRIRVESNMKSSVDSSRKDSNILAELAKKDAIIRDLEVRNEAFEQSVKNLEEENFKLKDTVSELQKKLGDVEAAQTTLLKEKEEIVAKASIRGFLLKRGVRGPTGRKWRRRYFRTDQAGRLCYYKFAEDSTPQGFIDLQSVNGVRPCPDGKQDKNGCTFEVSVDGRTYELLAMNQEEMQRWIDAIKYLAEWHRKNVRVAGSVK